jgi:hypothetical protein
MAVDVAERGAGRPDGKGHEELRRHCTSIREIPWWPNGLRQMNSMEDEPQLKAQLEMTGLPSYSRRVENKIPICTEKPGPFMRN